MPIAVSWEIPRRYHYKLNMDSSSLGNLEVRGMGGVFSDSSENWVLGFMKGVPKATNNMTELCALLCRLRITVENNYMPRKVNIDSLEVIDGDATSTSAYSLLQRTEPRHRLTS
ncbi:hypothetical protein KY289_027091 [Solanum tuberosum]|nr:hypothetical protein KY289_027091 [Solanum tuberosum]